jgi:glycosyltransferase involved in cell wall biosynthesis
MHDPFFTVITVTYNSSQFVRDAIESVLASTFTDFELIIGDDCSTDNTWEIINEYNDPRIVKYRNETNLREYPNRNKALNMARGEWVIFIDGDDLIYSSALQKLNVYIEKYSNQISMILMEQYLNWALVPFVISGKKFILSSSTQKSLNNIAFTNTLFNREDLLKYFNHCLKFKNGDQIVRLLVAQDKNILVVEDQLTWWRETPGQASSLIQGNIKTLLQDILFQISFIQKTDLLEHEVNLFIKNKFIEINRMLSSQIRTLQITSFFRTVYYFKLNIFQIIAVSFAKQHDFLSSYSATKPVQCVELVE